jgi:DNA-binding MarR family transcriptional regulator
MRKTNQEKIEDGVSNIEDALVIVAGKKIKVNTEFVILFYEAVGNLIDQGKITLSDVRVLFGICEVMKFGNLIALNQSALASRLGMQKSNMSKCISKLCAENILIKSNSGLFLNPTMIVKGKLQNIEPEMWDEAVKRGYTSPLDKGIRKAGSKKQSYKEDETSDIFEDVEMPF